MNYKDMYTVHYRKPSYNPYRSYPRNCDRYAGSSIVEGLEAVRAKIAELVAAGCTIKDIYNVAGRRITKEVM